MPTDEPPTTFFRTPSKPGERYDQYRLDSSPGALDVIVREQVIPAEFPNQPHARIFQKESWYPDEFLCADVDVRAKNAFQRFLDGKNAHDLKAKSAPPT
jgi:hypothetical protein